MTQQTETLQRGANYMNGFFINPDFEDCSYFKSLNPATGEVLGEYPQSAPDQVKSAYHFAEDASKGWRAYSRVKRAEYFLKLAQIIEERREDLANAISLETGKNSIIATYKS